MTTRQEYRENVLREILPDATQWPNVTLENWLNDAIRDYSSFFPQLATGEIPILTSSRQFDIDSLLTNIENFYGVHAVEYPLGEDPPRFLSRRTERSSDFIGGAYYDLRGDDTLVLGQTPTAGQTLKIWFLTNHRIPTLDTTTLTVPDAHLDALKLYIIWQAALELEMDEARLPDNASLLLSMHTQSASAAERRYRAKIGDLLHQPAPSGIVGPWQSDRYDRVY